jgi:hypothetical protein
MSKLFGREPSGDEQISPIHSWHTLTATYIMLKKAESWMGGGGGDKSRASTIYIQQ